MYDYYNTISGFWIKKYIHGRIQKIISCQIPLQFFHAVSFNKSKKNVTIDLSKQMKGEELL